VARHSTRRTDASNRGRARKLLLALTVMFLCVPSALTSMPSAAAAAPKQVLVLGDSLVGGSSNYIDFHMSNDGKVRTTIKAVGGTAICDLLAGNHGPWTLEHLLTVKRYDAVVLAYSGGGLTKCTGYVNGQALVDNYKKAATAVMKISQRHRVRNVVWVKPPAAENPTANFVRASLGDLYGSLPAAWPNARVIDGGRSITPGGTFHRTLPCGSWEKTAAQGCVKNSIRVGASDGVHFYCEKRRTLPYGLVAPCSTYSSGSNRYGMNLAVTRTFIGL
jgi:hypothetical protein